MNKARYNQLPPNVRQEIKTMSLFIRQCKAAGDKDGLRHWRDRQDGYLQGLVDAQMISQSEMDFIVKEDKP